MQKNYSKMNYMYDVANTHTAILNIRIFSRRYHITSDYGFLLRLVNTFTIDTDEYYLMCYKVNDTKTFKNLLGLYYIILGFVLKIQINQICILQIGAFNWLGPLKLYRFSAVYYRISLEGYQIICVRSFYFHLQEGHNKLLKV